MEIKKLDRTINEMRQKHFGLENIQQLSEVSSPVLSTTTVEMTLSFIVTSLRT